MEIIVAIIGSGALSAIISGVFSLIREKKSGTVKMQEGMKLLLLSSLKRDGKDILKDGKVSKQDYDAFIASYNAYKELGGDGWADMIKSQIEQLEIKC